MTPPPTIYYLSYRIVDRMSKDCLNSFQNRKSPRLNCFDYSQPNWYFITICTKEKRCIFGTPGLLSSFGSIAKDAFMEIPKHFPSVCVDKYVVMPNHVHAIIAINQAGISLPLVVGQYKSYVSRSIHRIAPMLNVWQTSFHDHIIRDQHDYQRIWEYIDTNPQKWQEDCFYSDSIP